MIKDLSTIQIFPVNLNTFALNANKEQGLIEMWQRGIFDNSHGTWKEIREYLYSTRGMGLYYGIDDDILCLARIAKYHQQHIEQKTELMTQIELKQRGYSDETIEECLKWLKETKQIFS